MEDRKLFSRFGMFFDLVVLRFGFWYFKQNGIIEKMWCFDVITVYFYCVGMTWEDSMAPPYHRS